MSVEAISLTDPGEDTEAAICRTLGIILHRGTFATEEVETIASAADNQSIDEAARWFADRSLLWLAQQSAMMTTPIWQQSSVAQH